MINNELREGPFVSSYGQFINNQAAKYPSSLYLKDINHLNMRGLLVLLTIISATITQAQKIPNPTPWANLITEADLKNHLYIVASKEFEGRETATEGQKKAAAYIENHFKTIGLAPGNGNSYQLRYPVYRDSVNEAEISVNDTSYRLNDDFAVNAANVYQSTIFGSDIAFAGYGRSDSTQDDYKGIRTAGKIVLLIEKGEPNPRQARMNQFNAVRNAQKKGAVAVLYVQSNFSQRQRPSGGQMYTNPYKFAVDPNVYYVSEKIARAIMGSDYDEAVSGKGQPKNYNSNVKLEVNKTAEKLESSDVLGYLEGTDLKDQLLVISAHYDHLGKRDTVIYYGADDDGSGTVSIMEIAAAFAKAKAAGKGPRRSILFLANSGEEKGLWGSAYYTNHPTYPLDKTTVDLNIDMIGRIDPNRKIGDSTNYVYVVGDDKLSSDLKPISIAQNTKFTKLELDYKFNDPNDPDRIYYRSDHYNFARKGVPIIFYFDGIHHDYHQPTDTPDKINYDIMAKRAKLVFYTAWDMANRKDMLKRDIPLK
ncbi:MAG TPA: M28 family peptidase [Puia sp.]|nr:M28 family peptidase [Puia sp.]